MLDLHAEQHDHRQSCTDLHQAVESMKAYNRAAFAAPRRESANE